MAQVCDLLDEYLDLVDETESPLIYHRWSMLTALGALFARKVRFNLPFGPIYPNTYCILIGDPATRKSTAIRIMSGLMAQAGYQKIASGRTTPEQFLEDLHVGFDTLTFTKAATAGDMEDLTSDLDFDIASIPSQPVNFGPKISDVLIAEGELLEFLGQTNHSFASSLTDLWDNHDKKDVRSRSGDKFRISAPTISLLGGATHTNFKRMFPVEAIGQGLLSRFILVFAPGARKKCFEPAPFDKDKLQEIIEYLRALYLNDKWPSKFEFSPNAREYSKYLYESGIEDLDDPRFQYYNGRRDTHYRKLCLIIAAANMHNKIEESDCFLANTILSYTEKFMPAALGEFGFDKLGEQTEMIFNVINRHPEGLTLTELLQKTTSIVHGISELANTVLRLQSAQRVERVASGATVKYLATPRLIENSTKFVNYELLQEYRENPTFNIVNYDLERRMDELELTAELQKLSQADGMTIGKRKPGRPPKNPTIDILTPKPKPDGEDPLDFIIN